MLARTLVQLARFWMQFMYKLTSLLKQFIRASVSPLTGLLCFQGQTSLTPCWMPSGPCSSAKELRAMFWHRSARDRSETTGFGKGRVEVSVMAGIWRALHMKWLTTWRIWVKMKLSWGRRFMVTLFFSVLRAVWKSNSETKLLYLW